MLLVNNRPVGPTCPPNDRVLRRIALKLTTLRAVVYVDGQNMATRHNHRTSHFHHRVLTSSVVILIRRLLRRGDSTQRIDRRMKIPPHELSKSLESSCIYISDLNFDGRQVVAVVLFVMECANWVARVRCISPIGDCQLTSSDTDGPRPRVKAPSPSGSAIIFAR